MKDTILNLLKTYVTETYYGDMIAPNKKDVQLAKRLAKKHNINITDLLIEHFETNHAPYFTILNLFPKDVKVNVLTHIFGSDITIRGRNIYGNYLPEGGDILYTESKIGNWHEWKYDESGEWLTHTCSNGFHKANPEINNYK